MGFIVNELPERSQYQARICDLVPGTIVRHSGYYYIKLDKNSIGRGLTLRWSQNHSVLLNIKLGSIREIEATTVVYVFDAKADLRLAPAQKYFKDPISGIAGNRP